MDSSSSSVENLLAILQCIRCRLEVHWHHLLDDFLELENFGFRNSLDIHELANRGMGDRLDRVVSGRLVQ
jgi:hypothetical protein